MIKITKGLDIPLAGVPEQQRIDNVPVTRVAVKGDDYVGLRPSMAVQEGDRVQKGQLLFDDKKNPRRALYCASQRHCQRYSSR
jgi:Na+-transporting NADH:ubiquinone oxidoreductase, subunit NqrA